MATNPVIRAIVPGSSRGTHGVPRQVHADLGFAVVAEEGDRMLDPDMGGRRPARHGRSTR